jgi:hypothetical protein
MKRTFRSAGGIASRRAGWRRHTAPVLLALALAGPGVAHPLSLGQLLRLPLEQLLQLQISPRRVAGAPADNAALRACAPADGRTA